MERDRKGGFGRPAIAEGIVGFDAIAHDRGRWVAPSRVFEATDDINRRADDGRGDFCSRCWRGADADPATRVAGACGHAIREEHDQKKDVEASECESWPGIDHVSHTRSPFGDMAAACEEDPNITLHPIMTSACRKGQSVVYLLCIYGDTGCISFASSQTSCGPSKNPGF